LRVLNPPVPSAARRHLRWHQLHGSASALALAEATQSDQRLYVVVADAARELDRLAAELRFFAGERLTLLAFPDWEVLPYDLFSPHPDIISERLRTLFELPHTRHGCLVVAADTLIQRLPPRQYVQSRAFELARGQALALEPFRQRLIDAGYASVSQVTSPGEFAVRGSLFDVFPMGAAAPLRIDLFDEEIEAIRRFDPESQRSLDSLDSVRLLPAREMPLDAEAVREFRLRFRTRFEGDPSRTTIYRGVSEGLAPAGIEFYLPLFFEQTATLLDYLPANAVIVHEGLERALDSLRGPPPRHRASGTRTRGALHRAAGARSEAGELLLHHSGGVQGGYDARHGGCGRAQLPHPRTARATGRPAGRAPPGRLGWLSRGIRRTRADRGRLAG
jgi:transcription-repair coupling factor (superfamily II helicase)